jgi:queuine tRNA-ribosyltransferase
MSFDECTTLPVEEALRLLDAPVDGLGRTRPAAFQDPGRAYGLFGIVQGSVYPALRAESARRSGRDRLRRLCGGSRASPSAKASDDVHHLGHDGAATAGRQAAHPDGRRPAGRHRRRREARHRHVRLRDADPGGRTAQAFTRRGELNLRNAAIATTRGRSTSAAPAPPAAITAAPISIT